MSVNGAETHNDNVTLGEVMRLIERNHQETREDFANVLSRMDKEYGAVNGRVDKTVLLDVYVSDKRADEERFKRLESDIVSARATTRWAIGLGATSVLTMIGISVPVFLASIGKS